MFEGDKLTITRDFELYNKRIKYTSVLYTDGRGEKNIVSKALSGDSEISSKTRWKKNGLIREYSTAVDFPGPLNMYRVEDTTEKYSLSENGDNLYLTIGVTTSDTNVNGTPAKTMGNLNSNQKLVFRRQQ